MNARRPHAIKACDNSENCPHRVTLEEAKKKLLSSDMVEVVRCKDCKHFKDEGVNGQYCQYHTQNAGEYCDEACWVAKNDYCSYGERRDQNDKTE